MFPTGRPAPPEDLVDRHPFIDEAVERLSMGHDIMLAGPRRIGKSSVAGEIVRRLRSRGAYTAYVDVFRTTSIEAFATRLLEAVVANRTGLFSRAARDMRELRKWLGQARISAKVHDLELGVALIDRPVNPADLLELALTTAETIAASDQRRMGILIDEFQDVHKLGGPEILKRMRSIIQLQQHTVYVFLGSQAHLMRDLFGNSEEAFFRFAIQMHLPPIPWDEWQRYIEDRLATQDMTIRDTALSVLEEKTGGHPHGVMVVTEAALLHARLGGKAVIEADDALYGYADALEGTLGAIYTQQWAAVRAHKHAANTLLAIAEGREPYADATHRSGIAKAITYLEAQGILITEGRGRHRLVEPMFGQWVRNQSS